MIILAVGIIAFTTLYLFWPSSHSGIMKESFENGFGDWTPDGSVPWILGIQVIQLSGTLHV